MAEKQAHKNVDKALIRTLGDFAEVKLRDELAKHHPPPTISPQTRKGIAGRVTPKLVAEFSKIENLPRLIFLEIESIGDRIRLYPFTALYREVINPTSIEMSTAWMLHSHSLRQGELYIIQERSVAFLRFLRDVAENVGHAATDRSKHFERDFKRKFERRLRERHRLVHAHERPSLTSRIIDFGIAAEEGDKEMVGDALAGVLIKIAELLPGEATQDPHELLRRLLELRDMYPAFAHQEAADMLDMLAAEVSKTFETTE